MKELLKKLRLYQQAAEMYKALEKKGLPVCFPKIVNEQVFEVQDFYPLHCGLSRKKYVFNSLKLDSENPIALVTGLNSGGKSSLLHTMNVITALARA